MFQIHDHGMRDGGEMSGSGKMALVEQLSDALLDPVSSERERINARRALQRLADEEALSALLERALIADDAVVGEQVIALLTGRRALEPAVEVRLIGFLYDDQPSVRQAILALLRDRGSVRMVPALERIVLEAQEDGSILNEADSNLAQQARLAILARGA